MKPAQKNRTFPRKQTYEHRMISDAPVQKKTLTPEERYAGVLRPWQKQQGAVVIETAASREPSPLDALSAEELERRKADFLAQQDAAKNSVAGDPEGEAAAQKMIDDADEALARKSTAVAPMKFEDP